ncbi:hypothetical protein E5D57_002164 [Metarhizium anisopliae]|nr:hypothetical protein E5D57_002164 [Metarhizium anisopliae]
MARAPPLQPRLRTESSSRTSPLSSVALVTCSSSAIHIESIKVHSTTKWEDSIISTIDFVLKPAIVTLTTRSD